jgi:hypothetical protein
MAARERAQIILKKSDPGDLAEEHIGQRKRPETGRFRLQVDKQTKASFVTSEDAEKAGLAIKKKFPIVQVTVYDSADAVTRALELSNETSGSVD